jgi:hypothetical protein
MRDEYQVMMSSSVVITLYMLMCGYQGSVSLLLSQQLYYAMAFGVLALYLLDCGMLHSYMMVALWVATCFFQTEDSGARATMIKYYILVYGGWILLMYVITLVMGLTTNTEKLSEFLQHIKFTTEQRASLNDVRLALGRQLV